MIEYGSRARSLPAPARVVWASLVHPQASGSRPWLRLLDDEVEPRILESTEFNHVVWSSLWPTRPKDRVVLEVHDRAFLELGKETADDSQLRFTLLTPEQPPDESKTGYIRHRMNHLLFADLRFSYGQ